MDKSIKVLFVIKIRLNYSKMSANCVSIWILIFRKYYKVSYHTSNR